jgi:hypothetical protein
MSITPDYVAEKTMGQILRDRRHEAYARRQARYHARLNRATPGLLAGLLAWLGARLVNFGSLLETRFGPQTADSSSTLLAES